VKPSKFSVVVKPNDFDQHLKWRSPEWWMPWIAKQTLTGKANIISTGISNNEYQQQNRKNFSGS
jgi:hypothetical protein